MTASVSMSVFHQWLLADSSSTIPASAIILHMPASRPCDLLIQEIASYLNEYDDDAEGRWLPATQELVVKVSRDPHHRRLLGMGELPPGRAADSESELHKTLTALGRRGHVVFRDPGVPDEKLKLSNTFHAGVGASGEVADPCHLILNPDLMDQKCIAHVIGDVFLEWFYSETRRNGIQDIR
jgi:hypothetical protein